MFGKITIYILFLRAYVVRRCDVVVNIARFCRRGFVLRAFITAPETGHGSFAFRDISLEVPWMPGWGW